MRFALAITTLMTFSELSALAANFPDPAQDLPRTAGKQTAVFAGGCFWCTEAVFEQLDGVEKVVSGYAGGDAATAKYDIVSAGRTEHAEVIEITYNPQKISYGQLLKVFFSTAHDPTQLNRQGPDWGKQYRSAIFYSAAEEKQVAEAYIQQLNGAKVFSKPIATVLSPLSKFYAAEGYHQDFVQRNPNHPYVVVNALPKIQKTRKEHAALSRK
jgi:peptide-methionine (S)-S-oxide reductase